MKFLREYFKKLNPIRRRIFSFIAILGFLTPILSVFVFIGMAVALAGDVSVIGYIVLALLYILYGPSILINTLILFPLLGFFGKILPATVAVVPWALLNIIIIYFYWYLLSGVVFYIYSIIKKRRK